MSSTEINVFFENPGLNHVGETILSFLDFQSLLACRFVCSSWKGMTQNSRFWVETKKVLQYLPPKQQKEWKKLISFSKVYLTFAFVCNVNKPWFSYFRMIRIMKLEFLSAWWKFTECQSITTPTSNLTLVIILWLLPYLVEITYLLNLCFETSNPWLRHLCWWKQPNKPQKMGMWKSWHIWRSSTWKSTKTCTRAIFQLWMQPEIITSRLKIMFD